MQQIIFLSLLFFSLVSCGQNNRKQDKNRQTTVGGQCEGCEAIYESKVPFKNLNEVDTLPIFFEQGPKLEVSGVVYKSDGKTPAPGVVLYVYHTDQTGKYRLAGKETGWAKRHGNIRGWVKTNAKGEYRFYTIRPAPYSKSGPPAHIHITVKEPDKNEYWIDDFHFNDDSLFTNEMRHSQPERGGNGMLKLEHSGTIFQGRRNIYLGKNIPDYPIALTNVESGLAIGENCPAFDPLHLSGADINTDACPMCKYGYGQGVMLWFQPTDLHRLKTFALALEKEMQVKGEKALRVFLIYMNAAKNLNEQKELKQQLKTWCTENGLKKLALLWVPSATDESTSGAFKINSQADNTLLIYKRRKVAAKWVNLNYDKKDLQRILASF